jgi:hypothetical protein
MMHHNGKSHTITRRRETAAVRQAREMAEAKERERVEYDDLRRAIYGEPIMTDEQVARAITWAGAIK